MFFPFCLQPVYLRAMLASDAGMINCCSLQEASKYCFRVPDYYAELLPMLPDCRSYASARYRSVDPSPKLLHAAPIQHDPYTPDSMDSPSPNAIITSAYGDIQVQEDIVGLGSSAAGERERRRIAEGKEEATRSRQSKRIDAAVSPTLLKSKLELIARTKRNERSEDESSLERGEQEEEEERELSIGNEEARKTRCNSDVSWQRSHLLTESWIRDEAPQGYRSFVHSQRKSSSDSSQVDPADYKIKYEAIGDVVIPRIAIINASNFESNESSVHLQEDRRLMTLDRDYSSSRVNETATSGEGSSLDTSDDAHNDELGRPGDENVGTSSRAQDSGLDVGDDAFSRGGSFGRSSNEAGSGTPLEPDIEPRDWKNPLDPDKIRLPIEPVISHEETRLLEVAKYTNDLVSLEKSPCRRDQGDDVRADEDAIEIEIPSSDSKRQVFSTAVNAVAINENPLNRDKLLIDPTRESLRLKAYRVTRKYKRDIVGKSGTRCTRCCCCCVIS